MGVNKTRFIFALTGYALIVGAIVATIVHYMKLGVSWDWFTGMFLFFLGIETFVVNMVTNNSTPEKQKKLLNTYMLSKVIKIILSLAFILIYYVVEKGTNIKMFVVIFISFYLLFLFAETYLLTKVEKHIKSIKK